MKSNIEFSSFLLSSFSASAPDFSKTPMKKLIQVQVGSEVSLDCKPRASPRALSSWKKGDVLVQETDRYSVVQKGGDLLISHFS